VVVSADQDASRAGLRALRAGGNAIDAAVATAFALSVVEPQSSGLGGGGFLLYYDARKKQAYVVDYREVAPMMAHRDMYRVDGRVDPSLSLDGIRSVAVPGMVPGLELAQKKFGKKQLRDVIDPAIQLAEDGFLVSGRLYGTIAHRKTVLAKDPEASRIFLINGEPIPVGTRLRQPDLAKTLRLVKTQGGRSFTHGAIGRAIAQTSQRLGGFLDRASLEAFLPRMREPLRHRYRNHDVITMPPPSSGGVHLLQMLRMIEIARPEPISAEAWTVADAHLVIEVMRRAYADRAAYMGDPAFTKIPMEGLLSDAYLLQRALGINLRQASQSTRVGPGRPPGVAEAPHLHGAPHESPSTTHLTVIDAEGNAVALTQTINYIFGAGVVVPGTGIVLNDEMDDFAIAPGTPNVFGLVGGEANSIGAGKIPLSSMTPTIVLKDGQVRLALGSPGGSTIINTVLQIILAKVDRNLSVAESVAFPRIHMQWLPDEVRFESRALDKAMRTELTAMGHHLTKRSVWGNATAIEVLDDGTRIGAADPRGDGAGDAE
jgi:gamma-glutamyltranspeptidase / glutathione hydrolase